MKKPSTTTQKIELPPLNIQVLQLTLIGDSALICHRWSEKARKAMLDKQMKKATTKKEAKSPEEDFEASLYPMPEGAGYGFPAVAFKAAAVSACRFLDDLKMTVVRGALHVVGELVKIDGEPEPREDMVRVGMGAADIRYRGQFVEWRAVLTIRYNAAMLSAEQVAHLFNVAGFGVGVGEWRPERNGGYGLFHVASETELE